MTYLAGAPFLTGVRRRALPIVLAAGAAVACAVLVIPFSGTLPRLVAGALCCGGAMLLLDGLGAHHPHPRFGLGNAVTVARGAGGVVFAALAAEPGLLTGSAAWAALAGAAALLALDGVDGRLARRHGLVSTFGARFDLEVDALLILALAALAAGMGKAGIWVLALGLLRYGFVLAGWVKPWLAQPLPPSRRRSAVCVLQVGVLGLMLAPPVVPPWSGWLAALAFLALAWSFAVDIRWLWQRR